MQREKGQGPVDMEEEERVEDYFGGVEASTFKKPRQRVAGRNASSRGTTYLLVGTGGLVLILFFIIVAFKLGKSQSQEMWGGFEERILAMEGRIDQMEGRISENPRIDEHDKKILLLMDRLGHIEDELSMKMASLDKQLAEMKKTAQTVKKPEPAPVKKKSVATVSKSAKTHQVRSGETLYSISRKYGKTVQDILDLNPAISGKRIYPGQKLTIVK